jgi:hypothetical protein
MSAVLDATLTFLGISAFGSAFIWLMVGSEDFLEALVILGLGLLGLCGVAFVLLIIGWMQHLSDYSEWQFIQTLANIVLWVFYLLMAALLVVGTWWYFTGAFGNGSYCYTPACRYD